MKTKYKPTTFFNYLTDFTPLGIYIIIFSLLIGFLETS